MNPQTQNEKDFAEKYLPQLLVTSAQLPQMTQESNIEHLALYYVGLQRIQENIVETIKAIETRQEAQN